MFVDVAKIKIKGGNGGNGAVAFHREKYIASGGPDGGDGGKGGNIIFRVDDNLSTLADFRYKRKYVADVHEFIDCYVVPKYLDELIKDTNAQQSFA